MLDMFATVPNTTVLTIHANQSSTTFSAFMRFLSRAWCRDNPINGFFLQLGDKRRRTGIRREERERVPRARHRDIHHPPLLRVLEQFLLGGNQSQQRVINDLCGKTSATAVGVQQNDMIGLKALGRVDGLEAEAEARKLPLQRAHVRFNKAVPPKKEDAHRFFCIIRLSRHNS